MADLSYWRTANHQRLSRRRALWAAGLGAGATFAAACGGGSDKNDDSGPVAQATSTGPGPAGPVGQAQQETPVKGGQLRQGTSVVVTGLDPHIEPSITWLGMAQKIHLHLGAFSGHDQKFKPIFAQTLEQPSPNEFVFSLRRGVKFQNLPPVNGREVTAQDVLYSYERFRDLPNAQNNDFFRTTTDKMEAIDPYTFKLRTKTPYAESISEIVGIQKAVVPREAVEKFRDLSAEAVGAGAYILQEHVKGERTVLRRNPDYFDKDLPHPDTYKMSTILDVATLLQAYKSDQLDINAALLTKLEFDDLKRNDKLVNGSMPALFYGSLGLNASIKPFDDKRVRQALWVGMDRQQFIDKIALGEGTPMGPLSNGLDFWALSQEELKPYIGYDPKKAKDLLTAAGYPNGFDMTIDTSGGVQFYMDHAELVVPELKKIGVNAKLRLTDLPSYVSDKLFKGNFDATVFTHNPYETPKVPLGFYHKNGIGSLSWFHYDNPAVTAALDASNAELDLDKRRKLIKDVQRIILEEGGPLINFYSPVQFFSYHKRVGGYDPTLRRWQLFRNSEFVRPA